MDLAVDEMRSDWEIRRLSHFYARALDSNLPDEFIELFTPSAIFIGTRGRKLEGRDEIRTIPGMLQNMFLKTRHFVSNQVIFLEGDNAKGEVYCDASHVKQDKDGSWIATVAKIRYFDDYRRDDGTWRFSKRVFNLDWSEQPPVTLELPPVK